MNYTEYGYDDFLSTTDENNNSGTTGLSFDKDTASLSGDLIQGGIMQSVDKKTTFDLQNGFINISDGSTDIVQLGKFPDGRYGLLLRDRNGNTILEFTGDVNIIQSSKGHLVTDYTNEQLILKDDGGNPQAILGVLP